MPTLNRDLNVDQGVGYVCTFTWTTLDGARQSLTGWTPKSQIRRYPSDKLTRDLAPYLTIIEDVVDSNDISGDGVLLNIPGDITRLIDTPGRWDLRLVDAVGGEHVRSVVLARGNVGHIKAITITADEVDPDA